MRRIPTIAALALAAALSLAAACSDDGPVAPTDDLGIESITAGEVVSADGLRDLSPVDRERVREILETARASLRMLRDAVRNGNLDLEQARTRARQVHADAIDALSEILTDDQLAVLRARLRRGPAAGPGPGGPPPGERPDLDLTDEQRVALDALHEELRTFVDRVRAAVRAGEMTAAEGRDLVRERAAQTRREACGILTDGQRAEVPFCAT